jgi:hypothetical protein
MNDDKNVYGNGEWKKKTDGENTSKQFKASRFI